MWAPSLFAPIKFPNPGREERRLWDMCNTSCQHFHCMRSDISELRKTTNVFTNHVVSKQYRRPSLTGEVSIRVARSGHEVAIKCVNDSDTAQDENR
jgi:hypothetical protein